MSKAQTPITVVLYPTGEAYIPGVPAVETHCDPVTAEILLTYSPPAFTTTPPPESAPETAPVQIPEEV